jgi:Holliday junction DNA helicase RuvB
MTDIKNNGKKSDLSLRPDYIKDFIGQAKNVENIQTYVKGAKFRKEALDHIIFYGPPGLGKTTLANIVASELGVNISQTSGPMLEKKGDLTAILTDLEKNDVLFIDEIHRIRISLEEILYKAMEDYQIDIMIGQGVGAKSITIDLQPFTLIGATTRAGLLSSPLRDRFGISIYLDLYPTNDLTTIVERTAEILKVKITDEKSAEIIAGRSRGTPRIANKLLKRIRDFAQVKGKGVIDENICNTAFKALGIDSMGFDKIDRKILLTIIDKFSGGPVGLSTLATAVHEERDTIEDMYEPFLVQQGYIKLTKQGRVATQKAYEHFNKVPDHNQRTLFDQT